MFHSPLWSIPIFVIGMIHHHHHHYILFTIPAKLVIYVFHHAAVLFALVACVSVDILSVLNALLMAQPLTSFKVSILK